MQHLKAWRSEVCLALSSHKCAAPSLSRTFSFETTFSDPCTVACSYVTSYRRPPSAQNHFPVLRHLITIKRTYAEMDDSPLGRLPAELRNQIYGLVMYESIPIHVGLKNAKRAKDALSVHRWGRKIMRGLALVLTCRQIYQESSSLYFAINTFEFSNTAALRAFVKRFGEEKVHALRDLTIERFAVTTVPLQGAFKAMRLPESICG